MIDLFAGCGGLTQGFTATGLFRPVAAVELDVHAAATYAQNFGDHVHVGDIADWVQASLPKAEVVVGGPPCQGFSALGRRNPADPRNAMWRHYVETLRRVQPALFVLENVPQFLRSSEFAQFDAETQRGGLLDRYALEPFVLNSANYGVPQSRRRAVVIGRLRELDALGQPPETSTATLSDAFPEWLHRRVTDTDLPKSTVEFRGRQIPGVFEIRDLHITRRPTDISKARFRAIPPGGNRNNLPDHLLTPCWRKHKSGSGDVMGRLVWSKPSVTIRTEFFKPEKGRYLHPDEDRPITHAEAAFIQGFPQEGFRWCGNKSSIARQIGNAVPPPLASAIASHLAQRLG
ncbi:DNA cytosine methyltransferase [Actinopolymorpha sp. NPDC004070]|uniref:DNA cytosine methyltransferase n=1 Tax=Actinopolymorpha sp. NPDC004070 TaxID=3154548 RepID=UPI00339F57D8